jgi:hypothetical protein
MMPAMPAGYATAYASAGSAARWGATLGIVASACCAAPSDNGHARDDENRVRDRLRLREWECADHRLIVSRWVAR